MMVPDCYDKGGHFNFGLVRNRCLVKWHKMSKTDGIVHFSMTAADNDGNASKSNVTQKKGPRARHEANRRYTPKKVKQKACGPRKADLNQALEEPHTGTWEDPGNGNLAATIRRPAMQIFNTSSHAAF
jgi:hypothetical protein